MIDIRAATVDDATALATIYAPYVVMNVVSFESEPPNVDEVRSRIEEAGDTYPWLIAADEASGIILGYGRSKPFRASQAYRWTVELAVYTAGDFDGKGINRTLLGALLATLTAQNFRQAIYTVPLPNDKFVQLYEGVGFQRAGHHREIIHRGDQWGDVGIWQRELSQAPGAPEEPLPFSSVGVVRPT